MPTPAEIAWRIQREGQSCVLRRLPATDVTVKAVVRGYTQADLVGALRQGDREVRISDAEIAAASWPGPPRQNDKITIDGRLCNVEAVETRRHRGEVAFHILTARG